MKENSDNALGKEAIWEKDLREDRIAPSDVELEQVGTIPNKQSSADLIFTKLMRLFYGGGDDFYLISSDQGRIFRIGLQGDLVSSFGRRGQAPGEFNNPLNLVETQTGDLIINDSGNRRIQIVNKSGEYLRSFRVFKAFSDYCVDPNGYIFTVPSHVSADEPLIEKLDGKGAVVGGFGTQIVGNYYSPSHNDALMAVNGRREIFVAWKHFNTIKKYSHDGIVMAEGVVPNARIEKLHDLNMKNMKLENGIVTAWELMVAMFIDDEGVYILTDYPRIKIYAFNHDLVLTKTYWAKTPPRFMSAGFFRAKSRQAGGRSQFFILQSFEDSLVRIYE